MMMTERWTFYAQGNEQETVAPSEEDANEYKHGRCQMRACVCQMRIYIIPFQFITLKHTNTGEESVAQASFRSSFRLVKLLVVLSMLSLILVVIKLTKNGNR